MIYAIGDSHVRESFDGIDCITRVHIGPITLKRVGYLEDILVSKKVESLNLKSDDILFFCFGEIDIRLYVKPIIENNLGLKRFKIALEDLLQNWVDKYVCHIEALNLNGARRGIVSVVPPTFSKAVSWKTMGTDEERSLYTKVLNEKLFFACKNKNWLYLDIYSKYKDENGMLPINLSDLQSHVSNSDLTNLALKELLLLKK